MKPNDKILVTGATGYIGEHVVKKLLEENYQPALLARDAGKINRAFRHLDFHAVDLVDFEKVNHTVASYQHIIHLGGRTGKGHLEDPVNDFHINALGTVNLLKACVNHKVKRFINMSSYEIYGAPQTFPVKETHPRSPQSPYAGSILTREIYTDIFHKTYGLNTVTFRIFNAYGNPISERNKKGVVSFILNQIVSQKPITLTGHPEHTLDFIHLNDIVQTIFLALTTHSGVNGSFNLATGTGTSLKDLTALIQSVVQTKNKVDFQFDKDKIAFKIVADIKALEGHFAYKPKYNLKKGIELMLSEISAKGVSS